MASGQQLVIQMTGGGPYGFRLLGGDSSPITIAKIRPTSKAQQAGLLEGDFVLAVNGISCKGLSHATVTGLTEFEDHVLTLHLLRGKISMFEVESAFASLDSQVRRLTEPEAASLVASKVVKQNNWSSEVYTGSQQNSSINDNGARFKLQLPPAGRLKQSIISKNESKIVVDDPFSLSWKTHLEEMQPYSQTVAEQQPGYYSRQEHSFKDGDVTKHTIEEVKTEKFGGTTMTKVTKEFSSSQTSTKLPSMVSTRDGNLSATNYEPSRSYNYSPQEYDEIIIDGRNSSFKQEPYLVHVKTVNKPNRSWNVNVDNVSVEPQAGIEIQFQPPEIYQQQSMPYNPLHQYTSQNDSDYVQQQQYHQQQKYQYGGGSEMQPGSNFQQRFENKSQHYDRSEQNMPCYDAKPQIQVHFETVKPDPFSSEGTSRFQRYPAPFQVEVDNQGWNHLYQSDFQPDNTGLPYRANTNFVEMENANYGDNYTPMKTQPGSGSWSGNHMNENELRSPAAEINRNEGHQVFPPEENDNDGGWFKPPVAFVKSNQNVSHVQATMPKMSKQNMYEMKNVSVTAGDQPHFSSENHIRNNESETNMIYPGKHWEAPVVNSNPSRQWEPASENSYSNQGKKWEPASENRYSNQGRHLEPASENSYSNQGKQWEPATENSYSNQGKQWEPASENNYSNQGRQWEPASENSYRNTDKQLEPPVDNSYNNPGKQWEQPHGNLYDQHSFGNENSKDNRTNQPSRPFGLNSVQMSPPSNLFIPLSSDFQKPQIPVKRLGQLELGSEESPEEQSPASSVPAPPGPPPLNLAIYGGPSYRDEPDRKFPSLKEKVKIANSVANSVLSPDNQNSRGQKMFLRLRENAAKWTTSSPDRPESSDDQQSQSTRNAWNKTKLPISSQQAPLPSPPQAISSPRSPAAQNSHGLSEAARPAFGENQGWGGNKTRSTNEMPINRLKDMISKPVVVMPWSSQTSPAGKYGPQQPELDLELNQAQFSSQTPSMLGVSNTTNYHPVKFNSLPRVGASGSLYQSANFNRMTPQFKMPNRLPISQHDGCTDL